MTNYTSHWLKIDQQRIDEFAEATLDHQYIHIDPQRAASTKFGSTIAHGFLSLSLLPHLIMDELTEKLAAGTVINYGINKLRFLAPVAVDSNIRLHWQIISEKPKGDAKLVTIDSSVEIEGADKPALTAEWLLLVAD